jgi:hypothetical protein
VVDVSGATISAVGRSVSAPGGTISFEAGGNFDAAAGSALRVSGTAGTDAGRLFVNAGGSASLQSDLSGRGGDGTLGGSFVLNAVSLNDFGNLNARLEQGGFNERRSVHVETGDLSLAAGSSINARFVDLTTDSGAVNIAGTIAARSDNERSEISLFGGQGVTLQSSAQLLAQGIGPEGRGGLVTLGTTAGRLSLASGSTISTSGADQDGRVLLRMQEGATLDTVGTAFDDVSAIMVEPVRVVDHATNTLTAAELEAYRSNAQTYFDSVAPVIRNQFTAANQSILHVTPGIELRRDGDLTIGDPIDLTGWRYGTALDPGALTIRATGSINVAGTISDGLDSSFNLLTGRSSTIRMTAGASLTSANMNALNATSAADLTISTGAVVRTGTGDLSLSATHDIKFDGPGAAAYTMGTGAPTEIIRGFNFSFPDAGGQLSLNAGHDVVGGAVQQAVGEWQYRQVKLETNPATRNQYGVDIPRFGWNLGTLGGGDLRIRAGNDVTSISAAAADSAFMQDNGSISHFGGGVLSIDAGRDISSAYLHMTHGVNRLHADGALGRSRVDFSGNPVGSVLSIQDAQVSINARTDVDLLSVFNPTVIAHPGTLSLPTRLITQFFTYTDDSALNVTSLAGNVSLTPTDSVNSFVTPDYAPSGGDTVFSLLPAQVTFHALSQDVRLSGQEITLFSTDTGQLDLFAARDIVSGVGLTMSDAPDSALPDFEQPSTFSLLTNLISPFSARHVNDPAPSLITAGRDIDGSGGIFSLAESVRMAAGRDIINTSLVSQNVRPADLTLVSAGRDIRYLSTVGKIEVGGPGRLDVLAGRHVDLGLSEGITTIGNLRNPLIPSTLGADLTVMAGLSAATGFDAFMTKIVAPSADYRTALIGYVEGELGRTGMSYDAALAEFQSFNTDRQRPFILETFFRELVASGREANTVPGAGFDRGFAAIDILFPGSRPEDPNTSPSPFDGDLTLSLSRIYTLDGGTISLLAPGGLVNVGLAVPPTGLPVTRNPEDLGIVAQGPGDVRIFTSDDVLVNASRIFTLGGGDIAIWATKGDIDAGRGSKSAVSAPAPTVVVTPSGEVTLDFAGAVAGSGIRTIVTSDDVEPGDVDLIAPEGTVNAGDAGIGSAGNLNVAARQVVGLDNIQVGGTSTGVPAETSSLGASLAGVTSVASSATSAREGALDADKDSEQAAPLAESALGWLDVFVEGFGEDVCKASDAACLNRNRDGAPK